tara:strand:+ start:6320 stop:6985 length:666 start_codon:yes stop_codon:yes gene_type:complete
MIERYPMPGSKIINIWLVEDNELYRNTVSDLVNELDQVQCSRRLASVEEALHELDRSDKPDLIFCDIGLPGLSGIEGVKKFAEIIPEVPIVMITNFDGDQQVFDAICAGAIGYLLKTSTNREIKDAVYEAINGGSPINPKIAHKILKMFSKFRPQSKDYNLSDRETEILKLIVNGKTYEAIGEELFISYHTVDYHIRNIYKKLQVHSRTDAVTKALKENLI